MENTGSREGIEQIVSLPEMELVFQTGVVPSEEGMQLPQSEEGCDLAAGGGKCRKCEKNLDVT